MEDERERPADEVTDGDAGSLHLPPKVEAWRKRSAIGALVTGLALGFQQALDPRKKQPSIQMPAPSDPNDPDAPVDVHVEPNQPDETVVTVRPWRLQDSRD
ncbi:MAG: hypothetical protein QOG03_627 [Actinomycetota bacterium]|nr:hypothetical protein [Actinomycetota bacterium]